MTGDFAMEYQQDRASARNFFPKIDDGRHDPPCANHQLLEDSAHVQRAAAGPEAGRRGAGDEGVAMLRRAGEVLTGLRPEPPVQDCTHHSCAEAHCDVLNYRADVRKAEQAEGDGCGGDDGTGNSRYLAEPDADEEEARTLRPLPSAAMTYCIAFGPRAMQKMLALRVSMRRETAGRVDFSRGPHENSRRGAAFGRKFGAEKKQPNPKREATYALDHVEVAR